jgi:hypothetical protein
LGTRKVGRRPRTWKKVTKNAKTPQKNDEKINPISRYQGIFSNTIKVLD